MHHSARYKNRPEFHIVFYDAKDIGGQERRLAERVAGAMAVNMNCSCCTVRFLSGKPSEREAREIEDRIRCCQP